MADTFLIDGTDIQTAARILKVWEGAHVGAESRGGLITYPGKDGETDVDQPFGPTVLSIGLVVRGGAPDVTGFNDQYRTLRRLCKPGKTVTLSKVLSYTGGDETVTATGKLRRISPAQLTPADYRVTVEFAVLDGLWYGAVDTIGTGTVAVDGDVRTQRMEITLAGGANPTVTNSTNGFSFNYSQDTTAEDVVIDVEARTATRLSVDVSQYLTWTRGAPFRLDAGSNTLTISSGTASIDYSPAFL